MKKNRIINTFKHSGPAFKAFFVLFAFILALSACDRPGLSAKYGAAPERKQNSAGTLSVILPADIAETGQKNKTAESGVSAAADGKAVLEKPVHLKPAKPSGDIVEIKEKMFIAQTNDVYINPEDYMGKTIKLEGLFKTETGYDEQMSYCFVLRYGPGCCGTDGNAGFEVAWDEAGSYPAEDDWVEAIGVLKSYEEYGYPYLYLALSSIQVLDERGAEFVTQ
ncbi:MAG: hypothetical protein LBK05_07570 [Treponema sp.]|jgi:uncharacterized membrane protein YcgQ (UPF0703/DUF1980 family)|nr:hypothetical protein [Treponema sp.]